MAVGPMTRRTIPEWSRSLANARRRAGLTQEQLALLLGISETTLARWERGRALPPTAAEAVTQERILATAERLADAKPQQISPEVTVWR